MQATRSFVLFSALLLLCAALQAQEPARRAITHEDVWLMKRVGTPAVSPDGTWVVFSVVEPAYEERDQSSDLWLARTDGSAAPRRLTWTRRGETGAAWSPNSRQIAFSSRREDDEVEQIYVMGVAEGGEPRRITDLAAGARAPVWSPDGAAILFRSDLYRGAATDAEHRKLMEERKRRRSNVRIFDAAPIRHWDRWLDERRPTLFVQRLEEGAQPRNLLAGTQLAASPGYGGRLETEGDIIDAIWSPDAAGIVFTATVNRHEWAYAEGVQSLWYVALEGGEPRRLTNDAASYRSPRFSRDSAALFAAMEPSSEKVYNARRLVRFSWPMKGEPAVVSAQLDRAVGDYGISRDGRTVFFLAEDAGRERLYRVSASGGAVSEVGSLRAGVYTGLEVGGDAEPVLVARWESAVSPAEVGRIDPRSGRWRAITTFNAARVAQIDWLPLRELWFTSSRGQRIHSLLALPPGFDPKRKYPLLVLIHGGPHTMWRDQFFVRWNYHLLAAPGYVVLLTNYTGSTGYGERFAQGIQGDPLEGPALEINAAADAAIRELAFIDGTRQAAGGASYGGHLTNWLAVTTDRYKALVSHAGLFDLKTQWSTSDIVYSRERNMGSVFWEGDALWRDQSPLYRAANLKTPMLVTIGERDFRVPINNTFELWTALQRQRVPVRLLVFPDENHWILKGENSRLFYAEVHDWLARHL